MIDFPTGVAVGTEFTAAGVTYIWNSQGWTVKGPVQLVPVTDAYTRAEADARFVNVPGDTMTGALTISGAALSVGTTGYFGGVLTAATNLDVGLALSVGTTVYVNGALTVVGSGYVGGAFTAATTANVGSSLTTGGNIDCYGGHCYVGVADCGIKYDIGQRFLMFETQYYFAWDPVSRNMRYTYGSSVIHTTWRDDGAFLVGLNAAYKPGGGAWGDSSDERIKTVIGDYDGGLDAILGLRPVRFTYKGNDTHGEPQHIPGPDDPPEKVEEELVAPYPNSPHLHVAQAQTEFIGLIAQEAEAHLPELVSEVDGFIDGEAVTDLRMLDTGPLIYALVNAVKELSARLDALENPT